MNDNAGLFEAFEPVAKILRSLHIDLYIGGSVTSSYHGASRSTMNVDVIADLKEEAISSFVDQLGDDYYASQPAIFDAISCQSCSVVL